MADCEWNIEKCTVDVDVQDESISAKVKNNVRIPISPGADRSKNGLVIEPVTPLDISVFDPSAAVGDYITPARKMWDWMDSLRHAIQYMTDGSIEVVSEWYEALPDSERIAIVGGNQLRTADTAELSVRITYDWNDIWLELANRFNLWICVRYDANGIAYLSVEPEADMYVDDVAIEALNQPDLIEYIDRDAIYSAIEVGDDEGLQNLDLTESLPYLVLRGFSKEKFHFQGVCNIDEVLDLVGEWHADSNTIERVLVTQPLEDGYDKDIFIIQYNSYTNNATKGEYVEAGTYLYNETMQNIEIVNRYNLPSDFGQYFNPVDAGFLASFPGLGPANNDPIEAVAVNAVELFAFPSGQEITYTNDTIFPGTDPDDNWDIAQQRYTAPAQGFYEFVLDTQIILSYEPFSPPVGQPYTRPFGGVRVIVERYDSSDTLISTTTLQHVPGFDLRNLPGPWNISFVAQSNLNVGDYVTFTHTRATSRVANPFTPTGPRTVIVNPGNNNSVRTTFVATGGGVLTSVDPNAARIVKYEFDRMIPVSEWDILRRDPRSAISTSTSLLLAKTTHASKVTREVVSGNTKFEVIAKRSEIR